MIEDEAVALLALLAEHDGRRLPAIAKRLQLGQSELFRLLTALGNEPGMPGLGLVEVRLEDGRERVCLTEFGKQVCAGNERVAAGVPEAMPWANPEAVVDADMRWFDDTTPGADPALAARRRLAIAAEAMSPLPPTPQAEAEADATAAPEPAPAPAVDDDDNDNDNDNDIEEIEYADVPMPGETTRLPPRSAPAPQREAEAVAAPAPATLAPEPLPDALVARDVRRLSDHADGAFVDTVIVEAPVALLYNGLGFAVMLATPTDLEDFALGFSLSEGIVAGAADWRLLERVDSAEGISLDMAIPQASADKLEERRRGLAGRSGCGLCGVESLRAALPPVPHLPRRRPVPVHFVLAALGKLAARQPLNARSGGVHAAAFVPFADPDAMLVREDVGRHNALDKVLGARARAGFGDGFLVVTSRASAELVHKAATCGIGVLVAISAPTSLAIRLAQDAGLTLVAFARDGQVSAYAHPQGLSQ